MVPQPFNKMRCDIVQVVAQRVRSLEKIARAAIAACDGGQLVSAALAGPHWRYAWVWAVGKAAASMAREFGGALVVDKNVAAHPVPDERSVAMAERLLAEARAVPPEERALLLLSGGASALVGAPIEGLSRKDYAQTVNALTRGGASIHEINVVRRHLSRVGGGRLALACPGAIDVLAISDVAGDDPATIGSGPASPDPSTLSEALAIARRLRVPDAALRLLASSESGAETAKPGDPVFDRGSYRVLASPETLRAEAARVARAAGYEPIEREQLVAGDVEDFAVELGERGATLGRLQLYIAVGEPTLEVTGNGLGGRAQHLALLMAAGLAGRDLAFVACGSDGSDGPTPAAGAAVDGRTLAALAERGVDAAAALARCDSHRALSAVGATITTGPTGTNLTDLYLLARG
jgi:hydroxypyruvate reductase